jgi:small membrane protein
MIIKALLVPALVVAVVLSLRARSSLRGQARRKILAVLTVVAGAIAVMFPDLLQALADLVGVTRGTDLMLYGLALVIIYLVGSTGVRFREQESRLVLLARQVALAEAESRLQGRREEYLPPRMRPPQLDGQRRHAVVDAAGESSTVRS